jgi:hypothetical protein
MFEITAVIGDLSAPVKLGWTLWFAWGVVSLGWYRHARVLAPVAPTMPSRFMPAPPPDEAMESYEEDPIYDDQTGTSYSDSDPQS